jgi:hypothetical protein
VTSVSNVDDLGPALSFQNGSYLLTWWQTVSGGFDADVRGLLVDAAGVAASPFDIALTQGVREMTPAVACKATSPSNCMVSYRKYDISLQVDRVQARNVSAF